jgi:hypothetical protein
MSSADIANRHFAAAVAEAQSAGLDSGAVCRALLNLVVTKYLETRSVSDVQSELHFLAENCDPDADLAFMRP